MAEYNNIEVFEKRFFEFHASNDDTIEQEEGSYIGYILPIDSADFVIDFMYWWVSQVDQELDTLVESTPAYVDRFGQRGYTLDEFRTGLNVRVKEESFEHERIFDYLYITDKHAQNVFIGEHTDEEKEFTAIYLESIKKYIEFEISDLYAFFFARKMKLYLPESSLERHAHILAKSGSGKSEIIKLMFYDLQQRSAEKWNKSLVAIAPEADLPTELLRFSLNEGENMKRVVYLDPFIRQTAKNLLGEDIFEEDYIFRINPFEVENRNENAISVHTQQLARAFFEIFRDDITLSPNMKGLVKGCINTLLRVDGSTIADLKRFMDDEQNDDLVYHGARHPNLIIRDEMKKFQGNSKAAPTKSSLNAKLYELLIDETFSKHLIGKQTVDLQKEINSGKVIICNLTKSKMGADAAPALGKLIVAIIQSAAQYRENIPKEYRKKTFLFLDEFQNYVNPSIKELMAETRKFKLAVILSHQVWMQEMTASVGKIVSGNTTVKIAGESDPYTRKELVSQLKGINTKDFEALPKYNFFVYDTNNKQSGTKTIKVPDFLVKQKPPFYMEKEALKRFFLWLVYESGYYVKASKIEDLTTKKSGISKRAGQNPDGVYQPKFDD